MNTVSNSEFIRYLSAKRTVDDRALNRLVLEVVTRALPRTSAGEPLTILEVGAGIGTMIERLIEWGILSHAHYTAIDSSRENSIHAIQRLKRKAADHNFDVREQAGRLLLSGNGLSLTVEFIPMDLYAFSRQQTGSRWWDLIIANAFLDLVDLSGSLPLLLSLCRREGLFYFTINYDGLTILEPVSDPALDDLILSLYHRTMDERIVAGKHSGDSRTGRHLITHLSTLGAEILAAGSSDWVVIAGADGYPADEAFFLHFIVDTIYQAVRGHTELEHSRLEQWIKERHGQIERGELVYIAHQIDVAGKYSPRV